MVRLPTPGADANSWGNILNQFLLESHNADGSLKTGVIRANRLDQMAAPTASVGLNSQKITGLADGTDPSDAAAVGQIPVAGTSAGTYTAGDDSRVTSAESKNNKNIADGYAPLDFSRRIASDNVYPNWIQPADYLNRFHAALQRANTQSVKVLVHGHSLVDGWGASNREKKFGSLVSKALRGLYGKNPSITPNGWYPGIGATTSGATSIEPRGVVSHGDSYITWPSPWIYDNGSGGISNNTTFGPAASSLQLTGTANASMTVTCDRFKIYYAKSSTSSSLAIQIDGATVATLDSYNASGDDGGYIFDSGSLTNASHTIKVTCSVASTTNPSPGSGKCIVEGIDIYTGDYGSGVHTWVSGHGGWGVGSAIAHPLGYKTIKSYDPDLIIVMNTANDLLLDSPPYTNTMNQLSTYLQSLKAATNSTNPPSIAVLTEYLRAGNDDLSNAKKQWEVTKAVCEANGALLIPVGEALKNMTLTTDKFNISSNDNSHLNDAGHKLVADFVMSSILPSKTPTPSLRNLNGVVSTAFDFQGITFVGPDGVLNNIAANTTNMGTVLTNINFFGSSVPSLYSLSGRLAHFLATATPTTWGLTASSAEFLGLTAHRINLDGTVMSSVRLCANVTAAGPTGSKFYLEYSTNAGSSWTQLSSALAVTSNGLKVGTWQPLAPLSFADYQFRVTGIATSSGNVIIGSVYLEIK